MASLYTTKTASLRATKADIKKLDAKQMMINGENITELWGLNLPKDYKKLVTRCELPDDKNWMLLNDDGELLYLNFSEKILKGDEMFWGTNLKKFVYPLSSLVSGNRMFEGCSLDAASVDAILDSIPQGKGEKLSMTLGEDGAIRIAELLGIEPYLIPTYIDGGSDYYSQNFAGWWLHLTTTAEFPPPLPELPECPECPEPELPECPEQNCCQQCCEGSSNSYDVVQGSAYIPDATKWNKEVYIPNGLNTQVVEIIDGSAYSN